MSWSSGSNDLRRVLGHATVFTHLEPIEDPMSFADTQLDRDESPNQLTDRPQ